MIVGLALLLSGIAPYDRTTWWLEIFPRSEEHTSELQSQSNLVCRLLLEKKKHDTNNLHILNRTMFQRSGLVHMMDASAFLHQEFLRHLIVANGDPSTFFVLALGLSDIAA